MAGDALDAGVEGINDAYQVAKPQVEQTVAAVGDAFATAAETVATTGETVSEVVNLFNPFA